MLNGKILTVEDANSVLSHFSKGFVDYYTLDTRLLNVVDYLFAYDFITLYVTQDTIQFNVANDLWTGGYIIQDSNIGSPSVMVDGNVITVHGSGLEWVVLVLELSPEFSLSEPWELDFTPRYTPVIRPFYEPLVLTVGFRDKEDAPVGGLEVTYLSNTFHTDSNGEFTIMKGDTNVGDADYTLSCMNNNHEVVYNFPYQKIKVEIPVILRNDVIYRDKKNIIEFQFLYDVSYSGITPDKIFGDNTIELLVDNKLYSVNEYDNENRSVNFIVPVGSTNRLNMMLCVGGNRYLEKYNVVFHEDTSFVTLDNPNDLRDECESDLGASVIFYTGVVLDVPINIHHDVVIRFTDLVSSSLDSVFRVFGGKLLTLEDCNFTGKNLIELEDASTQLNNCIIQHCMDTIIKGTGNVVIRDSSFIDNSNALNITGDVDVKNTLFDVSDNSYYDISTPAFLSVYGDLQLNYCDFSLDLDSLTSLGLGYVLLLLGKDSWVNGVHVKDLQVNEAFPMRKNTSEINVESTNYIIVGRNNKSFIWNVEDTNTVYSNKLDVNYIGG